MTDEEYNKFPTVTEGSIGGATIQTVNARDLHAFLGVETRFNDWITARIRDFGFVESADFVTFTENPVKGRPSKEYAISLDMGKELGMVERTPKGKEVRQYFIECERVAKEPADPIAVLNDPAAMRGILLSYTEKVLALEAKIESDKPKTSFYDAYLNADGLYTLQNAARALNCRPNLFVRWLKQKYMFYQGTALVPRIQYIQNGAFAVKSEIVDDKARPRSFVTAKGLDYFASRVPEEIKVGRAA